MVRIWDNPLLDVDTRLSAAIAEIERLRPVAAAAARSVMSPTWAGVCDEDVGLELALLGASMLPATRRGKAVRLNARKAARGESCTIRLPGCTGGGEDTVLAHLRMAGYCGTGMKPPDVPFAAFACSVCHDHVDRRRTDLEYEFVRLAHAEGCLRTAHKLMECGYVNR